MYRIRVLVVIVVGAAVVGIGLLLYAPSRHYLRGLIVSDFVFSSVRVTYPEGTSIREMALETAAAFPHISAMDFIRAASSSEGYLFPDTYLFSASTSAASIVSKMRENFDAKTATLAASVATQTASSTSVQAHSFSDIVIMASLLEKEVRTPENRRIVAGILWNRIERGMPLQVDAVFGYIFNRDTYSPSHEDLKVDSPYNTYTYKGLPPGPINNPGLDALDAALHPTDTKYLYYLTDKDGGIHFATTYAAHQANQKKYLK